MHVPTECAWCAEPLTDRRSDARYCTATHRKNARRAAVLRASGLVRRGAATTLDAALALDATVDARVFRALSAL